MAKKFDDSVLDAALAVIATSTKCVFCSAEPADYAGIAAVALVEADMAPADFTVADHTSGRKVTVAAKTGLVPDANGTVAYAAYHDGSTLLVGTTVTSQAVTTLQTWDAPAVVFAIADPT